MLHSFSGGSLDFGLPSRRSKVLDTIGILKHRLGLFKSLSSCLGEEEEDVDKGCEVEHAEDDVCLPLDVREGGRHKDSEDGVEGPVSGCGECDTLSTETEREEFGWVDLWFLISGTNDEQLLSIQDDE